MDLVLTTQSPSKEAAEDLAYWFDAQTTRYERWKDLGVGKRECENVFIFKQFDGQRTVTINDLLTLLAQATKLGYVDSSTFSVRNLDMVLTTKKEIWHYEQYTPVYSFRNTSKDGRVIIEGGRCYLSSDEIMPCTPMYHATLPDRTIIAYDCIETLVHWYAHVRHTPYYPD
jgi:hypothetical protein